MSRRLLCSRAPGILTLAEVLSTSGQVTTLPRSGGVSRPASGTAAQDSYLVDSASSHMLVSKIKPCMSKYKQSIR